MATETAEEKAKRESKDDAVAKSAQEELSKPGRYIVGDNIVDANGEVKGPAPKQ